MLPVVDALSSHPNRNHCSQIRDKSGNAAYMVRQLYQKYLLPLEYRQKRDSSAAASQSKPGMTTVSTYDRIVAAANGKEDMDVLGAVAALMDAPGAAEEHAHLAKRLKLESSEVSTFLELPQWLQQAFSHQAGAYEHLVRVAVVSTVFRCEAS